MDSEHLSTRLDSIPRIPFAEYPTRLEFLPEISRIAGREIFIKRDDQLGPGGGGNKTRKLEYLLAEAVASGAKKVATFGGLQSNHARITAAAARRCGLEPHLFYFEPQPRRLEGNLLLCRILGARLHFIPFGGGSASMTLERTIRLVRLIAWARIGRHYFIPVGGHSTVGCLGYVRAAQEIDQQARVLGIEDAWLVTAAGSGGTLAGLMAGFHLLRSSLRLTGIDVGKLWKGFPASIAALASALCRFFGERHSFSAQDVPLIEGTYVGERYGVPTPSCAQAMDLLARKEGIILDPVYTAKAFDGLLDLIRQQDPRLGTTEPVIFLHTGGFPALFAVH